MINGQKREFTPPNGREPVVGVGHGLQLQSPMEKPYCSCKLTSVRDLLPGLGLALGAGPSFRAG